MEQKLARLLQVMLKLLDGMFARRKGNRHTGDARAELLAKARAAGVVEDKAEALVRMIFVEAQEGVERVRPLSEVEQYLVASNVLYGLFGSRRQLKRAEFLAAAECAGLGTSEEQELLERLWPEPPEE